MRQAITTLILMCWACAATGREDRSRTQVEVLVVPSNETVVLKKAGVMSVVHLAGMSSPSKDSRPVARLRDLLFGNRVKVRVVGDRITPQDAQHRLFVYLYRLPDGDTPDEVDVNLRMIEEGFSTVPSDHKWSRGKELLSAQVQAKAKSIGMWNGGKFVVEDSIAFAVDSKAEDQRRRQQLEEPERRRLAATAPQPQEIDPDAGLALGRDYVLDNGAAAVAVCTDDESWDLFHRAIVVKDDVQVLALIVSGRVIMVPRMTKVRMIDSAIFSRRVRIMEGKHFGAAGWVEMEFVKGVSGH